MKYYPFGASKLSFTILLAVGAVGFVCALLLSLFPVKIYQTTFGQHTGIVTAIDYDGIIWKTYDVYFKTNAMSGQEDKYCVIDKDVKDKLSSLQILGKQATIDYEDYFIRGYPLCSGDTLAIITKVEVKE